MKPIEWNLALAPDVLHPVAYKVIGREALAYLSTLAADDMIGTASLVEALYPLAFAKESEAGMAARDRIFKALTARALGRYDLARCLSQGPVQRLGKSTLRGRPCLWHAPKEIARCKTCGHVLET